MSIMSRRRALLSAKRTPMIFYENGAIPISYLNKSFNNTNCTASVALNDTSQGKTCLYLMSSVKIRTWRNYALLQTSGTIDLSKWNSVHFIVEKQTINTYAINDAYKSRNGLWVGFQTSSAINAKAYQMDASFVAEKHGSAIKTGENVLDISSCTGNAYFVVAMYQSGADTATRTSQAYISKIWLE